MKREEHLWRRLLHCWQSWGPPPASAACPSCSSYPAGWHAERGACLLSSGPGGDSSSWPLARMAVAWKEAFRGLRGICWPNSCSWLPGRAGDRDGAARRALEHSPTVGRGNDGAAGELSGSCSMMRIGKNKWEGALCPLIIRRSKDNSSVQKVSASSHVTVLLSSFLPLMKSIHKSNIVNKPWKNITSHLSKS